MSSEFCFIKESCVSSAFVTVSWLVFIILTVEDNEVLVDSISAVAALKAVSILATLVFMSVISYYYPSLSVFSEL